ncbi:MAG: hypothetical protein DRH37_11910, partial [Deltaproteobacteria bacterium]
MADILRIMINKIRVTSLSLVGLLLICIFSLAPMAFADSLTITRSGIAYNNISSGETSFKDYDYDNDDGGLRIGKGNYSAKVAYEILLPPSTHESGRNIIAIKVTVTGRCNYSPKIIIGGDEYDLSG